MTGALRARPYPYRAILAVCSDLDETPSRQVYEDTIRFLNTTAPVGKMGDGVGLEIGNSMYFDMPAEQFSYWNTDDRGRDTIRALIRSGHVDCFHSYGDLATTRAHAARALDDLSGHGCSLSVWIDHAVAPTNLGADIMKGFGDVPGHRAYHSDLTCDAGVRYVWRGRVTSVIGQDVPRRLGGLVSREHLLASTRTVGKEWMKGLLGRLGNEKYRIHPPNGVLRPVVLRDGRRVHEFLRANPHEESIDKGDTATGLAEVVRRRMLDTLVERRGIQILYTHLGKIRRPEEPLEEPTRAALALLADYSRAGKILVTTTRRALDYALASRSVRACVRTAADVCEVQLQVAAALAETPPTDPRSALCGVTVYVPDAPRYTLALNGRPVHGFAINPPDETGRTTLSLPWPRLRHPD